MALVSSVGLYHLNFTSIPHVFHVNNNPSVSFIQIDQGKDTPSSVTVERAILFETKDCQ